MWHEEMGRRAGIAFLGNEAKWSTLASIGLYASARNVDTAARRSATDAAEAAYTIGTDGFTSR